MATTLIIGATRGIGLELVRQYAAAGDNVIACARDLNAAGGLPELAATADNISVEQLDIADPASIKAAKANIGAQPIDVVLVVAGITGGDHQSLDDIDVEAWHHALNANTVGPMLVAAQFKENLVAAGDGHLMIVRSQLAASTWPMGGRYIYATTKAAVNRVGQLLAIDWRDDPITVTLMHPGWVQTDMGGPHADITAEESASGIRQVIADATREDSGKFFKWNGEPHAW